MARDSFPPRPTWGVDDIPDLTGKVILVTGASIIRARCNRGSQGDSLIMWSKAAIPASAKKLSRHS